MSAKVTPLRFADSSKNLGEFKAEKFNLFDEDDLEKYAELRNRANDAKNGIKFELVREYSTKTTITETMEGGSTITTNKEDIILLVHYWEKPPVRTKRGDSADEDDDDEGEGSLRTVARGGVPEPLAR